MTLPGIAGTVFVHPVLFLIAADNVEMFSILGSANNVSPTCCLQRVVKEGEGDDAVGEDGRLGCFSLSNFCVPIPLDRHFPCFTALLSRMLLQDARLSKALL